MGSQTVVITLWFMVCTSAGRILCVWKAWFMMLWSMRILWCSWAICIYGCSEHFCCLTCVTVDMWFSWMFSKYEIFAPVEGIDRSTSIRCHHAINFVEHNPIEFKVCSMRMKPNLKATIIDYGYWWHWHYFVCDEKLTKMSGVAQPLLYERHR